jgi:chemotaxis protein MotB
VLDGDMDDDEEEVEEGAPAWMATFSDMATLLLTFFVLLLSFANMDVVQFRTMMGSVREAFGVQFESPGDFETRADSPVAIVEGGSPDRPSVLAQEATLRRIRQRLREEGLDGVIEVEATERGTALRIRDAVLFESGSDQLREEALPLLTRLAALSAEFTGELSIEGHTDDRPIHTARFPSNWELSAARATAVLRHLAEAEVAPPAMSIAGYADTRPVADNATAEGRSRNRRVEFIFVGPRERRERAGEGSGEAPGAGPDEGPAEVSAEVPSEVSAEVPSEVPSEGSGEVPGDGSDEALPLERGETRETPEAAAGEAATAMLEPPAPEGSEGGSGG